MPGNGPAQDGATHGAGRLGADVAACSVVALLADADHSRPFVARQAIVGVHGPAPHAESARARPAPLRMQQVAPTRARPAPLRMSHRVWGALGRPLPACRIWSGGARGRPQAACRRLTCLEAKRPAPHPACSLARARPAPPRRPSGLGRARPAPDGLLDSPGDCGARSPRPNAAYCVGDCGARSPVPHAACCFGALGRPQAVVRMLEWARSPGPRFESVRLDGGQFRVLPRVWGALARPPVRVQHARRGREVAHAAFPNGRARPAPFSMSHGVWAREAAQAAVQPA